MVMLLLLLLLLLLLPRLRAIKSTRNAGTSLHASITKRGMSTLMTDESGI